MIINNIPSSCHRGDCGFNFTDELTPELFRSHPSTGTSRTVITIIGQGFTLGNVDPTVRIGQANCAVSSFNDTTITCTAGPSQAGTLPISVHVGTVGRALRPMGVALFTYQLTVNSVDRNSGSVGGGTLIRIRGNGFPALPMRGNDSHSEIFGKHLEWIYSSIWPPSDVPTMCVSRFQREIETEIQNGNGTSNESMALNMTRNDTESDRMHPPVLVLVGDFPCLIVTSSLNEIACLTPPSLGGEAVVNISVCIEGELVQLEDGFSYTDNLTPSITNHSPSSTSVLEDVTLTLTGAQLDTTGDPVVVAIHLRTRNHTFCNVTSHSSSEIQCSMNSTALSPGRYRVGVFFPEQAHPSYQVPCSESGDCPHPIYTPLHFTVVLFVDSATPTNGSLLGDARLTISGGGFPTENLTVTIGNRKCELIGINESHITCNTPGLQRTHNGFMTGACVCVVCVCVCGCVYCVCVCVYWVCLLCVCVLCVCMWCVRMCVCVCVCVCIHVRVHECTQVHTSALTRVHSCAYMCVCIMWCVCTHQYMVHATLFACVFVCMCVCLHVHLFACMFVCMCVCLHVHLFTCAFVVL